MIRLVVPEMGNAELDAIRMVLDSGYLVQGSNVRRFEGLVADFLGIAHVVAASSGTAALHLAVMALGLGPGDEVIVPDFTFPATANVVAQVGARPVLADVSLETFNIDPAQVKALITPSTRAILPVHLFGLGVVQLERLDQILRVRRRLATLYDAALADIAWLQRPNVPAGSQHIYQSYVTLLDGRLDRPSIMAALKSMGVECTIGTYACHAQPFFQERYGYRPGDLPNSYLAFQRALTLPLHSRMSGQDVEYVIQALGRAVP